MIEVYSMTLQDVYYTERFEGIKKKIGYSKEKLGSYVKKNSEKAANAIETKADKFGKGAANLVTKPLSKIATMKYKKPIDDIPHIKDRIEKAWTKIAAAFKIGAIVVVDRALLQWIPVLEIAIIPPILKKIMESEDKVDKKIAVIIERFKSKYNNIKNKLKSFADKIRSFFNKSDKKVATHEMNIKLNSLETQHESIMGEVEDLSKAVSIAQANA